MFYGCERLESLDLSSWKIRRNITNIYMFKDCYNLTDIRFGPGWGKFKKDNSTEFSITIIDCGKNKGYKMSDKTWESMLNMYDHKKGGLNPIEIRLNREHNIPDGFKKQMEARGYIINNNL
jgi:surface protein